MSLAGSAAHVPRAASVRDQCTITTTFMSKRVMLEMTRACVYWKVYLWNILGKWTWICALCALFAKLNCQLVLCNFLSLLFKYFILTSAGCVSRNPNRKWKNRFNDKHSSTKSQESEKVIYFGNTFCFTAGIEKSGVNPPRRGAMRWMYFPDSGT